MIETRKPWTGMPLEERRREAVRILEGSYESCIHSETNGMQLGVLHILQDALEGLQRYIDDPGARSVTWDQPGVELHYPLDMDWKALRPLPYALKDGDLLREPEDLARRLGEIFADYRNRRVLLALNRGMAWRKQGDSYRELVPHGLNQTLQSLSEEEARNLLGGLFAPVILGRSSWSHRMEQEKHGSTRIGLEQSPPLLSEKDWRDLERALCRSAEAGLMAVESGNGGKSLSVDIGLAIEPAVLDTDACLAYIPVTVRLFFDGEGDPHSWSAVVRTRFWEAVLGRLKQGMERMTKERHRPVETGAGEAVPSEGCLVVLPRPVAESGSEVSSRLHDLDAVELPDTSATMIRPTIGIPFGSACYSVEVMLIAQSAISLNLPKRMPPRLEELEREEIERIRSRSDTDPDPFAGLKRRSRPGGEVAWSLTEEARRELKRRHGMNVGYIDRDDYGNECLYRLFEVGERGLLEIGLSLGGHVEPLLEGCVSQARHDATQKIRTLVDQGHQPSLFPEHEQERLHEIQAMYGFLRRVDGWDDARRMMEMLLGQVSRQGRNPVSFPVDALQALFYPDRMKDQDLPYRSRSRWEDALVALRSLTFHVRSYGLDSLKMYGGFLGEWRYEGSHYEVDVQPGFLGCIRLFESGKTRLSSGREVTLYNFQPSREMRQTLKGTGEHYRVLDAGTPFYNSSENLTPNQRNLVYWLENALTTNGDASRGGKQVPWKRCPKGQERRRLYTSEFCPLLPPGRTWFGALEHFRSNPETGRSLFGTESRSARHTAGLLACMGYMLPAGRAGRQRERMVRQALGDLQRVVIDYLGGVVVGRLKEEWIRWDDLRRRDSGGVSPNPRKFPGSSRQRRALVRKRADRQPNSSSATIGER